jgi:hypothetical protein
MSEGYAVSLDGEWWLWSTENLDYTREEAEAIAAEQDANFIGKCERNHVWIDEESARRFFNGPDIMENVEESIQDENIVDKERLCIPECDPIFECSTEATAELEKELAKTFVVWLLKQPSNAVRIYDIEPIKKES